MDRTKNIIEAQKLHSEINSKLTLGGIENIRLQLELKIMQHYFAYSNFKIPFKEWMQKYLEDLFYDPI